MTNFYKEIFISASKTFKDILFPKQCLNCHSWGNYICNNCSSLINLNSFQRCIICQSNSAGGYTHSLCKTKTTPDRLITLFKYQNKLVSKIINSAKLAMIWELFYELTTLGINKLLKKNNGISFPKEVLNFNQDELHPFVICPIPMTKLAQRYRGFNQSLIIARVIAITFNLPLDNVLLKSRNTKQQKLLNRQDRKINLSNSFRITQQQGLPSKIILIDDVSTTGSTFLEACKTLKESGVKEVWCIALAQD